MTNLFETEIEVGASERIEELQRAVNRYCLSLTRSGWDGDDLAQETWVKAWDAIASRNHANPEALLIRVAKHTWVDQTRRRAVWQRKLEQLRIAAVASQRAGAVADAHSDTTTGLEQIWHVLIRHLPPIQRAVFLLRDLFGYSAAEAATKLRTTEGAVKSALHRARQALAHVREELLQDRLADPVDEGMRAYLRMLASAYRNGDLAALLQLVERDVLEPVAAVAIARARKAPPLRIADGAARRRVSKRDSATPVQMYMLAA
ncbi:RNA polymerase sigma factor [Paenibacillus koleovorans]|uniref:RNA polymerase sigma factor n=1 Tax=Paenibacillus koleovorans TaxID=121608 RepID=UPI000FDB62BA|nr:RNA polymerase sigma factor [Paenibacillus koleovorans]